MLAVLLESQGRVIGRRELARRAGLTDLNERRCDSLLVQLRRLLGPTSIITVRRRGWMLAGDVADDARALLAHPLPSADPIDFDERGERAS